MPMAHNSSKNLVEENSESPNVTTRLDEGLNGPALHCARLFVRDWKYRQRESHTINSISSFAELLTRDWKHYQVSSRIPPLLTFFHTDSISPQTTHFPRCWTHTAIHRKIQRQFDQATIHTELNLNFGYRHGTLKKPAGTQPICGGRNSRYMG